MEIKVNTKVKTIEIYNDNKVPNNIKLKGLNGNQNLNNNYRSIDSTEGDNIHFNPSSNIIRVYTQQTNNDNTTNTYNYKATTTIQKN